MVLIEIVDEVTIVAGVYEVLQQRMNWVIEGAGTVFVPRSGIDTWWFTLLLTVLQLQLKK